MLQTENDDFEKPAFYYPNCYNNLLSHLARSLVGSLSPPHLTDKHVVSY